MSTVSKGCRVIGLSKVSVKSCVTGVSGGIGVTTVSCVNGVN